MANIDFKEKDGKVDIQGDVTLNGSELQPKMTAGDGISIKDNVVSSLLKGAMCRKLPADKAVSESTSRIDYDTEICSIGTGLTYKNGHFIVGEGITAIKFNFSHAFYNMTKAEYISTQIYKNDDFVDKTELWTFFDSGLSGAGGGTLLIPASSGDKFSIQEHTKSSEGYLNNNSFVEVEVF